MYLKVVGWFGCLVVGGVYGCRGEMKWGVDWCFVYCSGSLGI